MGIVVSRISTSASWTISAAVAVAGPAILRVMVLGSVPASLRGMLFRLSRMSVTSSTTPGIVENSCRTPSMRTAVMAAPGMEESRMRRRALPTVTANPRSKGWAVNLP